MFLALVLFIAGIAILCVGGELFVRGSSGTARIFGIKPLVVGLIITAFATSAPEFFVSFFAVMRQSKELAVGNILGSCICNIGLALGLAALVRPIAISKTIIRRELPILFAATIVFFIISLDSYIARQEALVLIIGFIIFLFYYIKSAKQEGEGAVGDESESLPELKASQSHAKSKSFLLLVLGLAGLLLGANLIVGSSVRLAKHFGISELVVGLTVVAIGTSLPEMVTTLIASAKGESEISVGNVIGSNLFNLLAIIGIVCLVHPVKIEQSISFITMPVLLLFTFALAPILKTGSKISRAEGAFLVIGYGAYLFFILKR